MDIKDFILIAGGALIAAVVAHGFWIAWRNRTEPLRLDIVPDLFGDEGADSELARFRGELPNGGGRRVPPQQGDLLASALADVSAPDDEYAGVRVPVLLEPEQSPRAAADRELLGADVPPAPPRRHKTKPTPEPHQDLFAQTAQSAVSVDSQATADVPVEPKVTAPQDMEPAAARVAEVVLPGSPIVDSGLTKSANEPLLTTDASGNQQQRQQLRAQRRQPLTPSTNSRQRQPRRLSSRDSDSLETRPREPAREALSNTAPQEPSLETDTANTNSNLPVEELIVLHLLAPPGQTYNGPGLVDMLRAQGLKFGAMNIFHRVDPMTKACDYSVANAMEPGIFDLADLENFSSRGLSFFLQLPGPQDPLASLEDMVDVVRTLAAQLGGDVKDESMSVLTGQTVAHMRQRISDYSRKRLTRRA